MTLEANAFSFRFQFASYQ